MPTIYEVAARAGVSPATVSRVMNGTGVSAANELKVRKAATELDYVPNRAARSLRTRSSEVIALIIPDIENPFFTAVARGVEDHAQEFGFSVVLCNSDERLDKEGRYLDIAIADHVGGIIIAPASRHSALEKVTRRGIPLVAVDRSPAGHDVDAVLADNRALACLATEGLYASGYQRVACITGPRDVDTAKERAAGWRRVFQGRHPELSARRYLRYGDYRVDGGRAAMESLMAGHQPPDAVFIANNLMAVGALAYLGEAGGCETPVRVIGVAALGDLPFAHLDVHGTSVVDLPARRMGSNAAQFLLERIRGASGPPRTLILR